MKISTIDVTAERPYQVVVGTGALDYLPQYLADVKRIAVIHPPVLREAAARIGEGCDAEVLLLEVPTAERAKTGEILQRCWDTLAGRPRGAGRRASTAVRTPPWGRRSCRRE